MYDALIELMKEICFPVVDFPCSNFIIIISSDILYINLGSV